MFVEIETLVDESEDGVDAPFRFHLMSHPRSLDNFAVEIWVAVLGAVLWFRVCQKRG